jgi:hypothetical protein
MGRINIEYKGRSVKKEIESGVDRQEKAPNCP